LCGLVRRATAFHHKEKPKKEDDILPVNITLGKTKLVFTDNGWELGKGKGAGLMSRVGLV
jgi:hypothetical protein